MTRSIAGARPGRRTSAALAAIALTVSVVAWPGCTAGGPAGPADDAVDAPDGGGESLPEASPDAAPDALPSDLVFPDLSQPDGCQVAVDLTGRYFRYSRFDVAQPAGPEGSLAASLSSLWDTEIGEDLLNIVYHVVAHDPATGKVRIEAGTAFRVADGQDAGLYRKLSTPAPGVLDEQLDGCAFRSRSEGTLDVFPDLLAVPIAILRTRTQGVFAPDGSGIKAGWLLGGICTSMTKQQYFKFTPDMAGCTNFYQFMQDLGVMPDRADLPCGVDDTAGYTFEGTFDAPATADFAPEPGDPVRVFACH